MVIGIAGKYCSGKNFVAGIVKNYRYNGFGFTVVDVDIIGHTVLERKSKEVISAFGDSITDSTGRIDRKKLGRIVFRSRVKKSELESILHPPMVDEVKEGIKGRRENTIINAAIMFDMGLHKLCDFVICVYAPFWVRFIRALKRDNLSIGDTLKRLSAQRRICPKYGGSKVDIYSVRNTGKTEDVQRDISGILTKKGLTKG
ncbi:MAG: dephospho-CoA kinase [Spirochaetales bacterium]|nr:dephospho-CoA kinase [Spirochaetales bacterium]